ncbi:DNA pol3 delta2 superfamily incomplete domain containing protein [Pandoravirus celtis]|nr:DNA pol3 delta2 superfamily incomplete domain containing protein [Pandoravirus celtis]
MTDYCQAHFDGAWWYTDLADTLAHRLRVGQGRFDADLAHINVLRNSCRGWWTWVDGTTTGPVFSEDAPKTPRAAKKPAPEGAQPRPMPATTTRRKHARAQHKQRPAGAVARGRPEPAQ